MNTRLKQIREKRNLTIIEVANLLGTTPRHVKKHESGEVKMKTHNYIKLARFYNLSLDYIAGIIDVEQKYLTKNKTGTKSARFQHL